MTFLLSIVGVLAIIMLVIGGIIYLFGGVNEKSVDIAKSIIKNALIGIVVVFLSLIVITQIANFFS